MKLRERYKAVNAAWPDNLPPLTGWEAVRAASRLWRWGRGETCPYEIRETSGNRRSYRRRGVLWVNPEQGWKDFVHDLSHTINLDNKGHSAHHARLERRMIEEVVKRGWLDGRLKEKEKEEPKDDPRAKKLESIARRREQWERKLRRAQNALKKISRQERYYYQKGGAR